MPMTTKCNAENRIDHTRFQSKNNKQPLFLLQTNPMQITCVPRCLLCETKMTTRQESKRADLTKEKKNKKALNWVHSMEDNIT